MATSSQVKAGLNEVADLMKAQRAVLEKAQQNAANASAALAAIATEYADVIATIQAYAGNNAFEDLTKAELAKLTAEFNSLKADADAIVAVALTD